jgi:DnaJ-class molecular chaperone
MKILIRISLMFLLVIQLTMCHAVGCGGSLKDCPTCDGKGIRHGLTDTSGTVTSCGTCGGDGKIRE